MKLLTEEPAAPLSVTGYGAGYIEIARRRHAGHLLLLPDGRVEQWPVAGMAGLVLADFSLLLQCQPDVVLLGTGARQQFPAPTLWRELRAAGLPLEVMATPAACRTYNILLAEGRKLAAALLIDPA